MPNWCSVSRTFYTDQAEAVPQVRKLYDDLISLKKGKSRVDNGSGNLWEGNVLDLYGYDWHNCRCRGSIYDIQEPVPFAVNGMSFRIDCEDAWGPNDEVWEKILDEKFPNVDMVYIAEEPGCGVYINTDNAGWFYPDRYVLAYFPDECEGGQYGEPMEEQYFETEEELLAAAEAKFNKHFSSVRKLEKFAAEQSREHDEDIRVHFYAPLY